MSVVGKDTILTIAQAIGISNLNADVAAALAPDVEYRMREIMQEAIKCMRHSKRSTLTTDDVNSALNLRNVEPLYGFASGDPLRFRRAMGHSDLFYIEDRDVDVKEIIDAPLPKVPLDTSVVAHWLAVEGVQPAIPENAVIGPIAVPSELLKHDGLPGGQKDDDFPIELKPPVEHVLSRELQLYFEKISELVITGEPPVLLKDALVSLATDSGLHPLVPYFTQFIADEVTRSLDNFSLLFSLMRVVQSLLLNPHIHIEPYLHQLMPSVITCLVAKRIGGKAVENHWELRDFTAGIVAFICKRLQLHDFVPSSRLNFSACALFGLDYLSDLSHGYLSLYGLRYLNTYVHINQPIYLNEFILNKDCWSKASQHTCLDPLIREFGQAYPNLQQRVTRTLLLAFMDPKRAMTQHYGAITGLSALGLRVVQLLILPNLQPYYHLLAPEMGLETQPNEIKRYEAWRVYGALQFAAGKFVYRRLKLQPDLLSSTFGTVVSESSTFTSIQNSQASVLSMTSSSRKRAANIDLRGHSSQKKSSLDSQSDLSCGPSTITDSVETESVEAGRSEHISHVGLTEDANKDRSKVRQGIRISNPLADAWKEDSDIGALLMSLVDIFGEGMLPYICTKEMSLFW